MTTALMPLPYNYLTHDRCPHDYGDWWTCEACLRSEVRYLSTDLAKMTEIARLVEAVSADLCAAVAAVKMVMEWRLVTHEYGCWGTCVETCRLAPFLAVLARPGVRAVMEEK